MIAFCGNMCTECPAFKATIKNDDNQRKKIAVQWQKLYNPTITPEDINCDGCLSENGRSSIFTTISFFSKETEEGILYKNSGVLVELYIKKSR